MPLFGGVEAGGTKFVCAVGTGPEDLRDEIRFPTTTPQETLERTIHFFRQHAVDAVGIASFGPVDLNPTSPTFGYITTTPKPGWANTRFAGALVDVLGVPVGFDTDVNVAALGEGRWGAARGLDTFVYVTVGTGIGGGGIVNGHLLHGLVHPEMGHLRPPRDPTSDPFPGICPYHGDCLEGLASGPALEARWGVKPETLPPEHPAWELEASYLAFAVEALVYLLSPQRIILGGGVMEQTHLFPKIREKVQSLLRGYIHSPMIEENIAAYVVPPELGNRSGVLGAIALAEAAYTQKRRGGKKE